MNKNCGGSPLNTSYLLLAKEYAIYLQTLGFSKSVVYGYPNMVRLFLDYLNLHGVGEVNKLTSKHVSDYFNHLQTRSNMRTGQAALSVAHLNKSFDALNKFLEFLHAQGLNSAPAPILKRIIALDEPMPQVLDRSQITQLYESSASLFEQLPFEKAEPRKALAILILDLCYGCGLRKGEAFKLTLSQVDFDRKLLFINQAKGYKDRYVPMSETVCKRLQVFIYEYRRDFKVSHNRVFPLSSMESMVYYMRLLRRASGLSFGLHTLRHSIATHLLQNGMSVEQIAQFLGHNSLESTQIYTHLIHAEAN